MRSSFFRPHGEGVARCVATRASAGVTMCTVVARSFHTSQLRARVCSPHLPRETDAQFSPAVLQPALEASKPRRVADKLPGRVLRHGDRQLLHGAQLVALHVQPLDLFTRRRSHLRTTVGAPYLPSFARIRFMMHDAVQKVLRAAARC
eukprot:4237953-Pleurochrysis_carterae.AAC.2